MQGAEVQGGSLHDVGELEIISMFLQRILSALASCTILAGNSVAAIRDNRTVGLDYCTRNHAYTYILRALM